MPRPPAGAFVAGDPENGERLPRALLFLAAVAGLFGFLLTLHLMPGEGGGVVVALPDYQPARDGRDMVASVLPALLGGVAGLGFVGLLPHVQALLSRLGGPTVQTLAGTAGFAVLAALWPALRLSGHHEPLGMLDWGASAGPLPLLALAALKVLALCLCLAAGWRGGANFLLLFVGAAVGAAVTLALPLGSSPTVALLAAMMAAATVGMGKPVAAVLIVAFLVSPTTVGPLSVGALVGFGLVRLGPPPRLH
jgi:H+/Cl- antiporter ClcA